ncbi:MAG: ectonucleotide pyrophosphatase/phosphodiesterase, partial [Pyrinomonadaceae bacterium]
MVCRFLRFFGKSAFLFAAFFYLLVFLPVFPQKPIKDLEPTVILVSLDGFRADYLEKYKPPTLLELAQKGVRADLIPVFPTKTFPNHYSIATGLYPERHGIVENNMYDFGTVFTIANREEVQNGRWWLGEPIWVTAEKQGRRTAAFFFPGTEAEIKGIRPKFWKEYDARIPYEERVKTILGWLDLPRTERPQLLILYFDEPDTSGHECGPESE